MTKIIMKPIRSAAALLGGLAIWAALAASSGPGVPVAAAHPPSSVAAAATLTTSVPQTASRAADVTEFDASAADEETCGIFSQMVDGIDTLSTEEQQQLVIEMVDAAEQSENPDLTRAVVDLGQGWLDGNPDQFAKGMRALSKICNVPYE